MGDSRAPPEQRTLRPGVGEALVRLNHLLRPLIHHQWAVKVATLNRLDEYQLERFLFGAERVPLERVRGPIIELQEGRCFYCAERLASRAGQTPDVDHFIPWSRYPDDSLENLVADFGDRDQPDRSIVITKIGDRDRSAATLVGQVMSWGSPPFCATVPLAQSGGPGEGAGHRAHQPESDPRRNRATSAAGAGW